LIRPRKKLRVLCSVSFTMKCGTCWYQPRICPGQSMSGVCHCGSGSRYIKVAHVSSGEHLVHLLLKQCKLLLHIEFPHATRKLLLFNNEMNSAV